VRIEQVEPGTDTQGLDRCYQIVADCERLDYPDTPVQSRQSFAAWMSGFGDPRHAWLAADDAGQLAGCYVLTLPSRENLAMAHVLLAVAPARRRAGIGTALLEHCAQQARQAGRVRLAGQAPDGSAGAAFGAAAGAKAGMAQVIRQLVIDSGLSARLAGLRAAASRHAAGYTLLSWAGATPEWYISDSARLSAAMADAPTIAGVQPPRWDASRIRAFEQTLLETGRHIYCVAARHDDTGCLTAVTQVTVDRANPEWAQQHITAVLAAHRGHRLGLLIKAEMLESLIKSAPGVRRIVARNAAVNEHMVAINEQLGYQISSIRRDWELDLAAALPTR